MEDSCADPRRKSLLQPIAYNKHVVIANEFSKSEIQSDGQPRKFDHSLRKHFSFLLRCLVILLVVYKIQRTGSSRLKEKRYR